MTPTTDVMLKIKKILELSNRSDSEAEAELAMGRAQELMAKYNLSMADVSQAADPKHQDTSLDAKRVKETHTRGAMYEYQQRLWNTIATVNLCWHFTVPVHKYINGTWRTVSRKHLIVGREANVVMAKLMGDYLEQTINRNCPFHGLSRSGISWKEGCAQRLRARLNKRYEELSTLSQDNVAGSSTALTLANVADREYDENYAFMYGPERYAEYMRLKAERYTARVTEAVVNGPVEKPETNAQRKQREARYQRENEREQRKLDRYWERRDMAAWYSGREKGNDISLDSQVPASRQKGVE